VFLNHSEKDEGMISCVFRYFLYNYRELGQRMWILFTIDKCGCIVTKCHCMFGMSCFLWNLFKKKDGFYKLMTTPLIEKVLIMLVFWFQLHHSDKWG